MNAHSAGHRQPKPEDRLLWESGDWTHLPEFVLHDYVNQALDPVDREIVEGHLAICVPCQTEVKDLNLLRAQLTTPPVAASSTLRPGRTRTGEAQPVARWWVWLPAGGLTAAAAAIAFLLYRLDTVGQQLSRLESQVPASVSSPATSAETAPVAPSPGPVPSPTITPSPSPEATPSPPPPVARAESGTTRVPALVSTPAPPPLPDTAALPLPDLTGLQTPAVVLRGNDDNPPADEVVAVAPRATRLLSDRPVFRWQSVPDAVAYEVLIADDRDTILAQTRTPIKTTFWQPEVALPRNRRLFWEVYALTADGMERAVSKSHRFLILERAQAGKLAQERQRYAAKYPLVWATLAAKAGLRQEAEQALIEALQSPDATRQERAKAQQWLTALETVAPAEADSSPLLEEDPLP